MNAPAPRIPPDGRLAELARMSPVGWFVDHATHSLYCGCTLVDADRGCDVGHALFMMAAKEVVPRTAARA